MIKLKINYLTTNGERKTRNIPYANPDASSYTLKDFATALYDLTDNTIEDIYKIDTVVLIDDSDDIVTPIVTSEKQRPNLTLDKYSLEDNVESDTVIATYDGDGTLSVQSAIDPFWCYYNYTVNGNQINFELKHDKDHPNVTIREEETYIVTLSETDSYESDTATVTVVIGYK